MSLQLSYVLSCDECGETRVLDTRADAEARRVYTDMGWRKVLEDRGLRMRCRGCMAKLDQETAERLTKKANGVVPMCTVTRPRYRPGWFPCTKCGHMVAWSDALFNPFHKEHNANLVCVPCAADTARRHGHRLPAWALPSDDNPDAAQEESQLTMF